MSIELVIFDCDGVLVDSEPITNAVLRDDLATRGLDLPVERVIELFVGGTMAGVMTEARSMGAEMPENWLDLRAKTGMRCTVGNGIVLVSRGQRVGTDPNPPCRSPTMGRFEPPRLVRIRCRAEPQSTPQQR